MELYTLDSLRRRESLVEGFESYIWTERYKDLGDIEIVLPSSQQYRNLLSSGTVLGLSESQRMMQIETIVDETAEDGTKTLKVNGTEITDILTNRVTGTGTAGIEPGTWTATGTPRQIIDKLFNYVIRTGSVSLQDKLPLLVTGSLNPAGNLPEDPNIYTIERKHSDLYSAIHEIADVWDLGFRLYKGPDDGKLYFEVYTGNDRTATQTILDPVIFSEDLESLQKISELSSIAKTKNVAHVVNNYRTEIVYAAGTDASTAGFAKRTLFVDATDITYPKREGEIAENVQQALNKASGLKEALDIHKQALQKIISMERLDPGQATTIKAFTASMVTKTLITSTEKTLIDTAVNQSTALEPAEAEVMQLAMQQRGGEELAKYRSVSAFDGEITQLSPYKYNRHYSMGDLVEMRNATGLSNQMLVTEQIFVNDAQGERAYPTLTLRKFIMPATWLSWENAQVWLDAPGEWATT